MLVFPVIMHIFINYLRNTLACMHCAVVNIYVRRDHESCSTTFNRRRKSISVCWESTNTTERVALCCRSFLSDFFFCLFRVDWIETPCLTQKPCVSSKMFVKTSLKMFIEPYTVILEFQTWIPKYNINCVWKLIKGMTSWVLKCVIWYITQLILSKHTFVKIQEQIIYSVSSLSWTALTHGWKCCYCNTQNLQLCYLTV